LQTDLSPEFQSSVEGAQAEAILRKCVHCGFCLATCPTYQLLGDELDSPRGRIYLVKQVLEGAAPTRSTQIHLDRCLTCRNCETTCPSGVDYGTLVDIGRRLVEARVRRPLVERALRWMLRAGIPSTLFHPLHRVGMMLRPLLPARLRAKVPHPIHVGVDDGRKSPSATGNKRVLLLAGCVQPSLRPNINRATARVLNSIGIQTIIAPGAGCCGAIRAHLADHEGGLADMRRNIDAWWPYVDASDGRTQVQAIVMNASGCGATVKEYARYLAHDPAYAQKARAISSHTRDVAELLQEHRGDLRAKLELAQKSRPGTQAQRLAVHLPCTLQHGQRQPDLLADLLRDLGFDAAQPAQENHLCCGSAGTYSILEPEIANRLRDRKLAHLRALRAPQIVSANIGCIQHLQSGTHIPVRHWIEVLDEILCT